MRQALDIVGGIKVCFVVTLSLSSLALRSSRSMQGKFNPLETTAPTESNTKGLDHWKRNSHLSLSVVCLSVGKPFAFSNDLFKAHNGDVSIYAGKRGSNSAVILPAIKAEPSTSKNVLIAFQSGDCAGGGGAQTPPKCHLFFLESLCCSKNVRMTFD